MKITRCPCYSLDKSLFSYLSSHIKFNLNAHLAYMS